MNRTIAFGTLVLVLGCGSGDGELDAAMDASGRDAESRVDAATIDAAPARDASVRDASDGSVRPDSSREDAAPDDTNPYATMEENTWRAVGEPISSVWSSLDPPLDPLTRGSTGLRAIVGAWCGAGWDGWAFVRSCGGHADTGYNRAVRYDIRVGAPEWASPDIRLGEPTEEHPCPYPELQGEHAGPPANHSYDGLVTTSRGDLHMWPEVPYDCRGVGNRAPARVWKLSAAGEWSIARDTMGGNVPGFATALLPDDKILVLSRYFGAVYDPAAGDYVPHVAGGSVREDVSNGLGDLGGFGNLVEAGVREDGSLRFLWYDYGRVVREIVATLREDGLWAIGGGRVLYREAPLWYTNAATYLPAHNAVMFWGGRNRAAFFLFDTLEFRMADYPEIREVEGSLNMHESAMQYVPEWDVVVVLGPSHTDGLHVFRPPSDLLAVTTPL